MVRETKALAEKVKPLIGEYIFGYDEQSIEVVVGNMLRDKKLTVSVAESCTGGYLSHMITSVPGSSEYFQGGIIPYSYNIKSNLLDVSADVLKKFGAVSEETITEMAVHVRENSTQTLVLRRVVWRARVVAPTTNLWVPSGLHIRINIKP